MADNFSTYAVPLDGPAADAVAITPSDSVNITDTPRGIYVGTAGNVVAVMKSGAVTFVGCAAGSVLPIRPTRINATNTTASNLVALY